MGWKVIPAVVHKLDDLHAELATIDENIQRRRLSALEEGEALSRRKEIYLCLHPETENVTERGGPGRGNKTSDNMSHVSFTEDAAEKTEKSRRTVERSVEVAEAICPAAKTQLVGTKVADNKSQLKKLGALPEKDQIRVAKAANRQVR